MAVWFALHVSSSVNVSGRQFRISVSRGAIAREDGAVSQTNRIRAIGELNKMLGFYAKPQEKPIPGFNLAIDLGDEAREQPADAGNPRALPEKSGGS